MSSQDGERVNLDDLEETVQPYLMDNGNVRLDLTVSQFVEVMNSVNKVNRQREQSFIARAKTRKTDKKRSRTVRFIKFLPMVRILDKSTD